MMMRSEGSGRPAHAATNPRKLCVPLRRKQETIFLSCPCILNPDKINAIPAVPLGLMLLFVAWQLSYVSWENDPREFYLSWV